ncbi:hypothetical protein KJ877_01415 [bacterium]|nr:hypothetical protein [bacterium]MBU1989921.1 hypothetical protein [bacterium]
MKLQQYIKTVFATMVFAGALYAQAPFEEDVSPEYKCEQQYNSCQEKCDNAADGSELCYQACEAAYTKCLSLANGESQ